MHPPILKYCHNCGTLIIVYFEYIGDRLIETYTDENGKEIKACPECGEPITKGNLMMEGELNV
jgi:hypothetical protein